MDRVNWMLILTGEVVLVLEAECLKFQVRFVVLHRLRLSPWAYASLPLWQITRLLHFGCGFLSLPSLWTFFSL